MKLGLLSALLVVALAATVSAWSNGYSVYNSKIFADDFTKWERVDMYGTHDYLAQRALDMLRQEAPEEAAWVLNTSYLYGTELPDSEDYKESLNDRVGQVLGFDSEGRLTDSRLADLAMPHYEVIISSIQKGAKGIASKWTGTTMSYISDAGLFSRVIPESRHGDDFERYVQRYTNSAYPSKAFDSLYGDYISFDGKLEKISVYDAVVRLGRETYLGYHGDCSASWMEQNYDLNNMSDFTECAGRNFNNIVNTMVDVLHTIYAESQGETYNKAAYDWEHMTGATKKGSEQTPEPVVQPPATPPATVSPSKNQTAAQPAAKPPATVSPSKNQTAAQPAAKPPAKADNSWIYALIAIVVIGALLGYKYKKSQESLPPKKRKAVVEGLEKRASEAKMVSIGPAKKKRR